MNDPTLTRAEIEALERPPHADEGAPAGYWSGGAVALVEHWRQRALAAEGIVQRLQRALPRHRVRP